MKLSEESLLTQKQIERDDDFLVRLRKGRIPTQFVKIFLNVSLRRVGDLAYFSPHFANSRNA